MSRTEICQNRGNNLGEAIKKVFETKDFTDVTFTVGRRKFKAHRLILASRCSEFSRLLLGNNCVEDIFVEDNSVTEIGFEILLRFIYTDTLGTDDKQSILEAYLAAKFYQQKKLMVTCEELMKSWCITLGEVCELLNVSFEIVELKENCLKFIKNNVAEVIESPGFLKLNDESMAFLLDNDILNSVNVKKRLIRIIEWGANQQNEPCNYAAVRDYFLKGNSPLLGKLKIEKLVLSDITEVFIVKYKGLLTSDEIMKFMEYQNVKNSAVLPAWCNTP